jgi:hypothetical protein
MAPRKAFLLRIAPELWDALERWAVDELRSVNGQIEYLLSRAVRDAGRQRKRPGGGSRPAHPPPEGPTEPTGGS